MSLTVALSNALSGLNVSSRAADIVSTNLANILTEGYAPRELGIAARRAGGASVTGVTRHVDLNLLQDRRFADSETANAQTQANALARLENIVGTPDETGSLSALLSRFEADLVSAVNRPEAQGRLQAAVRSAQALAGKFSAGSDAIQNMRVQAEADIARSVDRINATLSEIQRLNRQITTSGSTGDGNAGLQDARQAAIDSLAALVPLRQISRDNGAVALITTGGAVLLDGTAATLEFTPSNTIAPHMTAENGLLSGVTVNGVPIDTSRDHGPLGGGQLAGHFAVRDQIATGAQAQLDALARNLVERFQKSGLDTTRGPTDPSLFTDAGAAFSASDEIGLAARIKVNDAVVPTQGGALWRLRDGLGAAAPGPVGDSTLLLQLSSALSTKNALASGALGATARSLAGHLGSLSSFLSQNRLDKEQSLSFAAARLSELTALQLRGGVDSDTELQRMLVIEQAYTANARIIQTLDDMMQTLLRI